MQTMFSWELVSVLKLSRTLININLLFFIIFKESNVGNSYLFLLSSCHIILPILRPSLKCRVCTKWDARHRSCIRKVYDTCGNATPLFQGGSSDVLLYSLGGSGNMNGQYHFISAVNSIAKTGRSWPFPSSTFS